MIKSTDTNCVGVTIVGDYRLKRDDYSVNLYPHPTALSSVSHSVKIHLEQAKLCLAIPAA